MTKHNLKILRSEILTNLGHLERYNPPPPLTPKRHMFLEFYIREKGIFFLKKVTACSYRKQ